jgi:hypothetical protein
MAAKSSGANPSGKQMTKEPALPKNAPKAVKQLEKKEAKAGYAKY